MPSLSATLAKCLKSIERPGDFCTGGVREIIMPAIDVDGVGRIAVPVLEALAQQLIAVATPAPHGRGEQTIVDPTVRKTWQIEPGKVEIGGRRWKDTLQGLTEQVGEALGAGDEIAADFYKLLIYDAGSFFVEHRDTEKVPGMFATMVLTLPSVHRGGELIVRHLGQEKVFDAHPEEPSEIGLCAFYADCVHEVRPVTEGCRVALVFNLRFLGRQRPPGPPDFREELRRVADCLGRWNGEPGKLILPLDHAYTPAELSFVTLKGRDAGIATVLTEAAAEAGCDVHLALVSIEDAGAAEYSGYSRRRGRYYDDDDEDDSEFEAGDDFDRSMTLSEWRRPDGGVSAMGALSFEEDELCPPDALEDMEPDEEHFHEATGNEGASFERTYSRAGLVLWPRSRRLAVLNEGGLGVTVPYLEDLAARWLASGADRESDVWREADELVGYVIGSWPRDPWRRPDAGMAGRVLAALGQLGNTQRIDRFLAAVPGGGHLDAEDAQGIAGAAALLPAERATELMIRVIRRNANIRLVACGTLLLKCEERSVGDLARIGAALLEVLPAAPGKRAISDEEDFDPRARPEPPTSAFVVDALTALSLIDPALATRAVAHFVAWPATWSMDDILVPAARRFAKMPEGQAWPAIGRLREAVLGHLRARIALPLEPPPDWERANPLRCDCADCRDLGVFLLDPRRREWTLKAAADRRGHVEGTVRSNPCDVDLTTLRRGSPHTLMATKNQASYRRRVAQRRNDETDVAALDG
jgi:hypothetical protein